MSSFAEQPDGWVDDELRRVPLPEGLIARLRQIAVADDDQLDAALRHVPLPPGLLLKLRGIADYKDEHVDVQLRDVPVPSGLLDSLQAIPEYTDAHIDADLRDVKVPVSLLARLADIPNTDAEKVSRRPQPRRRQSVQQLAAAAALVLVITLSYMSAIVGFISTAYRTPVKPVWMVVVRDEPLNMDFRQQQVDIELAELAAADTALAASAPQPAAVAWTSDDFPLQLESTREGPYHNTQRWFDQSKMRDNVLDRMEAFGSPVTTSEPPFQIVADVAPRGVVPAWIDAELLLLQMRYGVHPLVNPASGGEYRSSHVPLEVNTASYERAWDILNRPITDDEQRKEVERELKETIRTEEFLAAVDYQEPPPVGRPIALRAYGGPSPFAEPGTRMLQVIVRAGEITDAAPQPTHLAIAVDTSASMAQGDMLIKTRRALHRLIDRLGPHDFVSFVAYDESAQVLLETVTRRDAVKYHRAVDLLTPGGTTNIGQGLRTASRVAREAVIEAPTASRVVLISDGAGQLSPDTAQRIEQMLARLADDQMRFSFVDVSRQTGRDDFLVRLADVTRGDIAGARDATQIDRALTRALAGRSQVVAAGARLRVHFNPDAVSAYRLLGHEASSAVGVVEGPVEIDVPAGQTATGLFELRLKPNGGNQVGHAEVSWRDPQTSETFRLVQPISRLQFASSFDETALSLQAATIAAETAELMRGSYFADRKTSSLRSVRRLAYQVDPGVLRDPSYQRLLRLLDLAIGQGLR